MKKILLLMFSLLTFVQMSAVTKDFGKGKLTITPMARNAVRIQFSEDGNVQTNLPDWLYVKHETEGKSDLKVKVDNKRQTVTIRNKSGKVVFRATRHQLISGEATLAFESPKDECLFGLGQFQDGYSNVRGLTRRLTQVNTQISLPMLLSSKGYGVLWNNYGLVDYNPADNSVKLNRLSEVGTSEVVNVTSTEGGRQEVRQRNIFEGTIDINEAGDGPPPQPHDRWENRDRDAKYVVAAYSICHRPPGSRKTHAESRTLQRRLPHPLLSESEG